MNRIFLIFLGLVGLAGTSADAQTRERAYFWTESMPKADSKAVPGVGLSEHAFELFAGHRFFLDSEGSSVLYVGGLIRRTALSTELDGNVAGLAPLGNHQAEKKLWFVIPQFTWLHSVNDKYSVVLQMKPGYFTDFDNVNKDHLRVEGTIMVDRVYADGWTVGLGVSRASNFGNVIWIPVVHLLYTGSNKFVIDVIAPARAEFWYLPDDKWELGIVGGVTGAQYRIGERGVTYNELQVAHGYGALAAKYPVLPLAYLTIEGGMTFLRKVVALNSGTEILNLQAPTAPYVRAGFQLRF